MIVFCMSSSIYRNTGGNLAMTTAASWRDPYFFGASVARSHIPQKASISEMIRGCLLLKIRSSYLSCTWYTQSHSAKPAAPWDNISNLLTHLPFFHGDCRICTAHGHDNDGIWLQPSHGRGNSAMIDVRGLQTGSNDHISSSRLTGTHTAPPCRIFLANSHFCLETSCDRGVLAASSKDGQTVLAQAIHV